MTNSSLCNKDRSFPEPRIGLWLSRNAFEKKKKGKKKKQKERRVQSLAPLKTLPFAPVEFPMPHSTSDEISGQAGRGEKKKKENKKNNNNNKMPTLRLNLTESKYLEAENKGVIPPTLD
jgi:hypothetical protein